MLYLSDVLRRADLEAGRTLLVRHPISNPGFKKCYDADFLLEYTQMQKRGFSIGYDHIIVFVGSVSTSARLMACYKVISERPLETADIPEEFPDPPKSLEGLVYLDLVRTDVLAEYENKLVIDWGKVRKFNLCATHEKPILSLQANSTITYPGYVDLVLSHAELVKIINDPVLYSQWHTSLSDVCAVYLITDTKTGKHYVGSATGDDGLLGRWRCYALTQHGGNKGMRDVLVASEEEAQYFQYSILQIFSKATKQDTILQAEELFKRKLMSYEPFGMNCKTKKNT